MSTTPHLLSAALVAKANSQLTSPQREVASKGGKASSGSFRPGDERAREAGRKGGKASNRSSNGGGNNGTADYDEDNDDGE